MSHIYDASLHEWKTVRTVVANKLITFASPKSVFKDLQILTVLYSNLVYIENFIDGKIKYVVLNEENCYLTATILNKNWQYSCIGFNL